MTMVFNHFRGILGANEASKINQIPRKIDAKRRPKLGFNFFTILRSSGSLERPSSITSKGVLRLPRLSVQSEKITTKTSQKPSFSLPKSSPNRVQVVFKTASESTTIFYSILKGFGRPKWSHVGAMLTPKIPQNSTKIDVRNEVEKMMKNVKKNRRRQSP